jgi:hypothetical protein
MIPANFRRFIQIRRTALFRLVPTKARERLKSATLRRKSFTYFEGDVINPFNPFATVAAHVGPDQPTSSAQFATPSLERANIVGSPDCARSGTCLKRESEPVPTTTPDTQASAPTRFSSLTQVCRARLTVCYTTFSHAACRSRYYSEAFDARSRLSP